MTQSQTTTQWWQRDTTPGYILIAATILSFIAIRVGGPMLGPIRGRGARIPGQRSVLQGNK